MERTRELNGAEVPVDDIRKKFYLVDPQTKQKILIREMTDAQLTGFRAGVSHLSAEKMKAVMTRMQILIPALDMNLLLTMLDDANTYVSLRFVLDYEQNRRANLPSEVPA